MDVDLDRAGGVRKSVDDDRSLRRTGDRSLLDRMRDYGVDSGAAPISLCVAHASRVKSPVRLGPIETAIASFRFVRSLSDVVR